MNKDYLLRLYEGIGRGQAVVRRLYDWKARSPLSLLIATKDMARWLKGRVMGPSAVRPSPRAEISEDLHDLNQRLIWGRAMQALAEY
jgi:hypothetical protein